MADSAEVELQYKDELEAAMVLEQKHTLVERLFKQLGQACREVLEDFYFKKHSMTQISKRQGYANEQIARNKNINASSN